MTRFRSGPFLFLLAAALGFPPAPAGAHGGSGLPVRPVLDGIVPALPGVRADIVFTGDWQVRLGSTGEQETAVLDGNGRPWLRIGPGGVTADVGAVAWYEAGTPGVAPRLPDGVGPGTDPDWRAVSVEPAWAWFDPSLRADPALVTGEVVAGGVPVALSEWRVDLRAGETAAAITGTLEYEPVTGVYEHTLTGGERPAPGIQVGLLLGQTIPTLTLGNRSSEPVTILGADGEPFARVGAAGGGRPEVEVNVRSPMWLAVSQFFGRIPTAVADVSAPPEWQVVAAGYSWSWPDFRGRPPDTEPLSSLVEEGEPLVVGRWSVPLLVGGAPVEVEGVTEFVPSPAPGGSRPWLPPVLVGAAAAIAVGAFVRSGRR